MGTATVARLRVAVADHATVARYRSHIQVRGEEDCWPWTGAISGNGHGRFQLGDEYVDLGDGKRKRVTRVVIAHRFGYAVAYGVDKLLKVPILAHRCDNPLCQNAAHWRESDHSANRREYLARRAEVLGALADVRGARGRARAVRDAARDGGDVEAAAMAGAREGHRAQESLFAAPTRVYGTVPNPDELLDAAGLVAADSVSGAG